MSVAYRELVRGLAALDTDPDLAGGGVPALDHLLHVGQYALGALGMAVVEWDGRQGRVVGACGVASWALGRPVDAAAVSRAAHDDAEPYSLTLDDLAQDAAEQFASRGCGRILVHRIGPAERPHAHLAAMLDPGGGADPDRDAALTLVGAALNRLYARGEGLPVQRSPSLPDRDDRELLVAVTSHELRTPVTVIKGYADTLRDHWDQLDEETRRDAARVIGQRADELSRLVDRLLSASVSTRGYSIELTRFDLVTAVRRAIAQLPDDLRARLTVSLPEALPPALGDAASVGSVVTELVTNATKYSPAGCPVELTAGADRRTVHFRVADRGIGIAAHHAHRAFERFWQGDTGDKRRYGGAGLGLYLVRKTIERQHGWVSLRPRDGGGSLAEIRLPRGDLERGA